MKSAIVFFALLTTACASSDDVQSAIKLNVPAEIESIQPVPVKRAVNRVGRKPLSFAGYRVVGHRFPTTRRSESDMIAGISEVSASREQKLYRFKLETPAATQWNAECWSTASGHGVRTPSGNVQVESTNYERFDCRFDGPREWRLEMKYGPRLFTGDLMSGDEAILVRPVDAKAGPLTIPGGYVFTLDRKPVAALSIIEPGSIRIDPDLSLEHRDAIAAAASALLLNQP